MDDMHACYSNMQLQIVSEVKENRFENSKNFSLTIWGITMSSNLFYPEQECNATRIVLFSLIFCFSCLFVRLVNSLKLLSKRSRCLVLLIHLPLLAVIRLFKFKTDENEVPSHRKEFGRFGSAYEQPRTERKCMRSFNAIMHKFSTDYFPLDWNRNKTAYLMYTHHQWNANGWILIEIEVEKVFFFV